MQHKKLYIFDWDGTLMDSIGQIVASIQWVAGEIGTTVSYDAAKNIIGLGLPEAVQILFPKHAHHWDEIRSHYSKNYVAHSHETPLYSGARELIELLHAQDNLLAVATGKSRAGLDRVLAETALEPYFHATRGADETKSKPHPLMLEEILAQTGVTAADAVMIGDTSYDMEMAQNLGMDRVAVTYGVHELGVLEKYTPNHIVHDVAGLKNILVR